MLRLATVWIEMNEQSHKSNRDAVEGKLWELIVLIYSVSLAIFIANKTRDINQEHIFEHMYIKIIHRTRKKYENYGYVVFV